MIDQMGNFRLPLDVSWVPLLTYPNRIIFIFTLLVYCAPQFSSVAQSCLILCNPMDCSTPGFPVHQQLLELAQTHVHRAGDAIQPSYSLSSLSPPAFNLSQHHSLFQWVRLSHQELQLLKYWSFSIHPFNEYLALISFRIDWFDLLAVQGIVKSLPSTTVQKHLYFSAQPSLWPKSHICNDYWKNHSPDYMDHWQSDISAF